MKQKVISSNDVEEYEKLCNEFSAKHEKPGKKMFTQTHVNVFDGLLVYTGFIFYEEGE